MDISCFLHHANIVRVEWVNKNWYNCSLVLSASFLRSIFFDFFSHLVSRNKVFRKTFVVHHGSITHAIFVSLQGRAEIVVRLLLLKSSIELFDIWWLTWGRQLHCVFQGASHHVPNREDAIDATTDDKLRGVINTENVVAMAYPAFPHNCEIICVVRARPHHQLSTPASSNQPELTHLK